MDILLNNELTLMQFYTEVKNIHMERTLSQISYLWLSSDFIRKNG